jgi:hypothetical protein
MLIIKQTILIYTPEALAKNNLGSNNAPAYVISHYAEYGNVLESFNDRSKCKLHVYKLNNGKIEVSTP